MLCTKDQDLIYLSIWGIYRPKIKYSQKPKAPSHDLFSFQLFGRHLAFGYPKRQLSKSMQRLKRRLPFEQRKNEKKNYRIGIIQRFFLQKPFRTMDYVEILEKFYQKVRPHRKFPLCHSLSSNCFVSPVLQTFTLTVSSGLLIQEFKMLASSIPTLSLFSSRNFRG